MTWCEHCRDHFDENHYLDEPPWTHKVGDEYGPVGRDQAELERLRTIWTLARAYVAAYHDDWETCELERQAFFDAVDALEEISTQK